MYTYILVELSSCSVVLYKYRIVSTEQSLAERYIAYEYDTYWYILTSSHFPIGKALFWIFIFIRVICNLFARAHACTRHVVIGSPDSSIIFSPQHRYHLPKSPASRFFCETIHRIYSDAEHSKCEINNKSGERKRTILGARFSFVSFSQFFSPIIFFHNFLSVLTWPFEFVFVPFTPDLDRRNINFQHKLNGFLLSDGRNDKRSPSPSNATFR